MKKKPKKIKPRKNRNKVKAGRLGGSVSSDAKRKAAKKNGKLGGRPKNKTP